MNIELNPNQDGTKRADIGLPANTNFTTAGAGGGVCDGYLVKIANNNGVANFVLPTAATDQAVFILAQSDVVGATVFAESPDLGDECKVMVSGAVLPGAYLSMNTALYGTLFTPAGGSGNAWCDFIAEEAQTGTVAAPVLCKARRISRYQNNF